MVKVDQIIQNIRAAGHRMTPVRRSLLGLLKEHEKPHTSDEIRLFLERKGVQVNKTTVYRELDFLQKEKVISPVHFRDRAVRYELNRKHHHHVICESCGLVMDVEISHDLDKVQKQIERQTKFIIKNHALEFFGFCKKCQ